MKEKIGGWIIVLSCCLGVFSAALGEALELGWDTGTYTELYSTDGTQTNYLFKITLTETPQSVGLWRSVLSVVSGEADLYLKQGAPPTTLDYDLASAEIGDDQVFTPLIAGQEWYLFVEASEGAEWTLCAGDFVEEIVWDDGSAASGSELTSQVNSDGKDRYFKIVTEAPDLGVWRTVLNVSTGEASFYMSEGGIPTESEYDHKSDRAGDDGVLVPLSNLTGGGQIWYILVKADAGTDWSLFSGDIYVTDLGALAADESSGSGLMSIAPEGACYFRTAIPANAYAWRLWVQDAAGSNTLDQAMAVSKDLAPTLDAFDRTGRGQMLLVPDFVEPGSASYYYAAVFGVPGETFRLDSRRHSVTDISFHDTVWSDSVSGFLFKTYRVSVPSDQIAWEIELEPLGGSNPDLAVNAGKVPNAFNNMAFSELDSTTIRESITLVPPNLSAGAFYITVYSASDCSFNLHNREPAITQIDYQSVTQNDDPLRAGWRFFAVTDIDQQLGSLGWLLSLTNHVQGSEISIRRNDIPGRWSYREDGGERIQQQAYSDGSSALGFLQDPAHEADIWYVGVYSPDEALGNFTLNSGLLTAETIALDGHASSVAQLLPKTWTFYHVNVPEQQNGEDIKGWEVSIDSWTGEMAPNIVMRRGQLPRLVNNRLRTSGRFGAGYNPYQGDGWDSGSMWLASGKDWSAFDYDATHSVQYPQPMLSMAMGRPLEPGSYYIGFYNDSDAMASSFSFETKAIGTGMSYDPQPVLFAGGSVTNTGLPARDVAYYQIEVPSNQPNWQLELENIAGDSSFYLRRGYVPTLGQTAKGYLSPGEQNDEQIDEVTFLKKSGNEHFVLFPENCFDTRDEPPIFTVPAGMYYLMVVSEGRNALEGEIGTGTCDVALTSKGELVPVQLGVLTQINQLSSHGSYEAGSINFYQFDIGAWVGWYQVSFSNTVGSPVYSSRRGRVLDNSQGGTSRYGGYFSGYDGDTDFSYSTPSFAPYYDHYNVIVGDARQADELEDGEYDMTISPFPYIPIDFDGGGDTVSNLTGSVVYRVDVPGGIDGWELRVTEWSGSRPVMTVCREAYPDPYDLDSTMHWDDGRWRRWDYAASTNGWEWSAQWATSSGEWSEYRYSSDHQKQFPQYLISSGVDRPLTAGSTYYISFNNPDCATDCSFSFESRGIGAELYYTVQSLPFSGGSGVEVTNLPAFDVAYFKVDVPEGMKSWKVQLENSSGESSLYIRRGTVPTYGQDGEGYHSPGLSTIEDVDEVTRLQKPGDEHFLLLPEEENEFVTPGSYYLMVVSEGQNPTDSDIGTGSCSAVLHSLGEAPVTQIGDLPLTGEIEIADSYAAGESKLYQFSVPEGVLGLEVSMLPESGAPIMNVTTNIVAPEMDDGVYYRYGGLYSGYEEEDEVRSMTSVTVSEPTNGVWTVLVHDAREADSVEDASYTMKVLTLTTEPVDFDGGQATATNHLPDSWVFYKIDVPTPGEPGGDFLGWELRVTDWTGEDPPHMVIRRGSLPDGITSHEADGRRWYPRSATDWPSGYQWATDTTPVDWTEYRTNRDDTQRYPEFLLSMGAGRPLEPGSYLIGFYNPSASVTGSFSFVSSAIGPGRSYEVTDIAFDGGAALVPDLAPRAVAYFSVEVPENSPSWDVRLENISGESMLYIRKDYLPTFEQYDYSTIAPDEDISKVVRLKKNGDEHYALFPHSESNFVSAGTYYLMVVGEGLNPGSSEAGSGVSRAVLHSLGTVPVTTPGVLDTDHSLSFSGQYGGGDINAYQFNVASNVAAFEVRFVSRSGDPSISLAAGSLIPQNEGDFSYYGGMFSAQESEFSGENIVTAGNAQTGSWSMVISDPNLAGSVADGAYNVKITALSPLDLNADGGFNTNGNTNAVSGELLSGQSRYYRMEIPEQFNGKEVAGWYLNADVPQGALNIRARYELLPEDDNRDQTGWGEGALMVSPPLLTAGVWYVEIEGVGATAYTLTSSLVEPLRHWAMPAVGEPITALGLSGSLFGDSGVDEEGIALPGDRGLDLNKGCYAVYAVDVPGTNAGLLRTQLEAISGNPNLYIRKGAVPTLNHDTDSNGDLYDREMAEDQNTEYGNWVPLDGRNEHQLDSGTWFLMVKAEDSDARYRLKVSGGNVYPDGNVQDLPIDGGSFSGQLLAANDWRYYRLQMPDPVPSDWTISFSEISGDVDLYIRDTVSPGNDKSAPTAPYYIIDWRKDDKLAAEEPYFPNAGSYTLDYSLLLPGHTYYLGFVGINDASFSVSSSISSGPVPEYETVDFFAGSVSTNLEPGGSVMYQIDVPEHAVRWYHSTTNSSDVKIYLKQGSVPTPAVYDYYRSRTGYLDQYLLNEAWPWLPGKSYYLLVTNTASTAESFDFVMSGSSAVEVPANVQATDGTRADYINVMWTGISGVTAYDVWRGLSANLTEAVRVAERVAATSYSDYNAVPGVSNYYWVAVYHAPDTNWISHADSGWVSGSGTISDSAFSFGYEGGTGSVSVAASSNTLWGAYDLDSWIDVDVVSTDRGDGTVFFSVDVSASAASREGTLMIAGQPVTIQQAAYGIPTGVQASDGIYSNRIVVTWDEMPLANYYSVYRTTTPSFTAYASLVEGNTTQNTFTDTTVTQDQLYYYWVKVRNPGGTSDVGLPDSGYLQSSDLRQWQETYFAAGEYPGDEVDSDGDGYTNIEEYIAGTDPTNGASFFNPQFIRLENGSIRFEVTPSVNGRVYDIQWTSSLQGTNWTGIGLNQQGNGGALPLEAFRDGDVIFFRTTVREE